MGFLKRIFSIGSKRNKNKNATKETLPRASDTFFDYVVYDHEEDQEAVASRLLRSSSARLAVVQERNRTSLPPLPHSMNNLLDTPSHTSTTTPSVSTPQRNTYNVTVHRRQRIAVTEFPNANRDTESESPHMNASQIMRLRQDPSVASLLDMYDDHGHLPSEIFSNTPPSAGKLGRAQVRRNGSTLRQLLGNPRAHAGDKDSDVGDFEGDISWAERFLGETNQAPSASSLALDTPLDLIFPDLHSQAPIHDRQLRTFSYDHDISTTTSSMMNYPAISSMEVELSKDTDASCDKNPKHPYLHKDPTTPQRASQVFDFLTEKRRPRLPEGIPEDLDRSIPCFPWVHSLDEAPSNCVSHFSDSSDDSMRFPTTEIPPLPLTAHTPSDPQEQTRSDTSDASDPDSHDELPPDVDYCHNYSHRNFSRSHDALYDSSPTPHAHPVKFILTTATPVNFVPSRMPRGPRPQCQSLESHLHSAPLKSPKDVSSIERSAKSKSNLTLATFKDPYTPPPQRPPRNPRRASTLSLAAGESLIPRPKRAGATLSNNNKENNSKFVSRLPITPVRSKSLFASSVNASPASSSEMSPIGQQLMVEARRKIMEAREVDKQRMSAGQYPNQGESMMLRTEA